MAYQHIFRRYELKYLLDPQQQAHIMDILARHMAPDRYGLSQIRNIYYDTDSYRLIRTSMAKPVYKEKLRLRSYGPASNEDNVFVELKKKYDGVVYKRRIHMPYHQASTWLSGDRSKMPDTQIGREIQYFADFYGSLRPAVFLSYERQAWYSPDGSDFRITLDQNILSRQTQLELSCPCGGAELLPTGKILMELKTAGGIPLWMAKALTECAIFKTSFSKYGTAYETTIFEGGIQHVI